MFPNVNFHARFCIRATGSHGLVSVCSGSWCNSPTPYCAFGYAYRNACSPVLKRRESIARKTSNYASRICHRQNETGWSKKTFVLLAWHCLKPAWLWFWPDRRVRKWFDVEGLDNLKRAQSQNRGVMVVGVHFMSLELGGRVMGLCQPMMATYRPHNNKLMEWIRPVVGCAQTKP